MKDLTSLTSKIEQLAENYLASRSKVGVMVAVSQAEQTYIQGFGHSHNWLE